MATNIGMMIDKDMWNHAHVGCPKFLALISAKFCPYCGDKIGAGTTGINVERDAASDESSN